MKGKVPRDRWADLLGDAHFDAPAAALRANGHRQPSAIDMHEVFRQLITDEIRTGQLTRGRRRRIVRYAARLGLSAVEAGHLISICREEVRRDDRPSRFGVQAPRPPGDPDSLRRADDQDRHAATLLRHGLRVVKADPRNRAPRKPVAGRVLLALAIMAILIVDFLLMRWML